jgi:hypothetical protein
MYWVGMDCVACRIVRQTKLRHNITSVIIELARYAYMNIHMNEVQSLQEVLTIY